MLNRRGFIGTLLGGGASLLGLSGLKLPEKKSKYPYITKEEATPKELGSLIGTGIWTYPDNKTVLNIEVTSLVRADDSKDRLIPKELCKKLMCPLDIKTMSGYTFRRKPICIDAKIFPHNTSYILVNYKASYTCEA